MTDEGSAGTAEQQQGRFGERSPRGIVRIHRDKVQGVAMMGHKFASASSDGTVKIFNLMQDKLVMTLGTPKNRWSSFVRSQPQHRGDVVMNELYAVAFAKTDSAILGCASANDRHGSIHIWNHETGERYLQIKAHAEDANCIDFHPSQNIFVSGSDDHTARITDFVEGKELRQLRDHQKEVYGTVFLGKDLEYNVATCSFDTRLRVYDLRDASVVHELELHSDRIFGLDYNDNSKLLATGGDDGLIGLWDVRTWQRVDYIDTRRDHERCEVKKVAFDDTGSMLAAACSNCSVLVYDVNSKSSHQPQAQEVAELVGHEDCVFDVAWGTEDVQASGSQKGKSRRVLVSASYDATTRVWVEQ